jgi:hypothetical protein
MTNMPARSTFVWGLQRSGIHLVVGWLYANHGGIQRDPLPSGLHPQLGDGFRDVGAGVAFFNNPGRLYCRGFGLGKVTPGDFEAAVEASGRAIFSIEDCELARVDQLPPGDHTANVMLVRHPLNLVASRLRGAQRAPELFRTDERFLDVLASYCAEALGRTHVLPNLVVITYDRFVRDRTYRDRLAAELGVPNHDAVTEVSEYGGGSSFTQMAERPSPDAVTSRYLEQPLPPALLQQLLDRPAVVEACHSVFGFELADVAGGR